MVLGGTFTNREGPAWLPSLLTVDTFFAHCSNHTTGKNEKNHFCFNCQSGPLCPEGLATSHRGHVTIQIRRASHRDVVRIADIQRYVDLAGIQPYTINGAKIAFLQSRPQPKIVKGASHYCETCQRSILDPVRFCSILCKLTGIQEYGQDCTLTTTVSGNPGQFFISNGRSDSDTFSSGAGIPDFMPSTPQKAPKRASSEAPFSMLKKLKVVPATDPVSVPSVLGEDEVFAPSTPTSECGPRVHNRKQVRPHRSPIS